MLFQAAQLFFICLRFFEGKALGGIGHKGLVMADDLSAASAEDVHDFLDIGAILLLGDIADAGSLASAYMEIQARAELVAQDGLGGNLEITGA